MAQPGEQQANNNNDNIQRLDNGNEHDSSFSDNSFSSEDEFKRDSHYRPLYRQDSEENSTFDEESSDDEEENRAVPERVNENGLYNHNVIVEWISTNEPLFDRAEYEARLRRIIDSPADENSDDSDVPNENRPIPASSTNSRHQESNTSSTSTSTVQNEHMSTSSTSSSMSVGEDRNKTIMNIMANINIPTNNQPDWARDVGDNDWKTHLNSKLNPKKD